MVHLDKQQTREQYEALDSIAFIQWVTDGYLAAVGGTLTAENMEMLSAEQHAVLCYRYVLDEVMEGGFIQLILNSVEGQEKVMKDFSKLLYAAKSEYHKHQEELSQDMSDEDFMALYEQLEELNELGDDFLDEHQEEVSPALAKMIVENLEVYV